MSILMTFLMLSVAVVSLSLFGAMLQNAKLKDSVQDMKERLARRNEMLSDKSSEIFTLRGRIVQLKKELEKERAKSREVGDDSN